MVSFWLHRFFYTTSWDSTDPMPIPRLVPVHFGLPPARLERQSAQADRGLGARRVDGPLGVLTHPSARLNLSKTTDRVPVCVKPTKQ